MWQAFLFGLLIGLVTGGALGAVIMAAFALAKQADIDEAHAHEIIDLNHQTSLAPGDPGYVADRFYREKGNSSGETYRR
jgi:hypothetical protein